MTHAMDSGLVALIIAASRTLLLAVVAALALKVFRATETSIRLLAWRTVLVAALTMPLLGMLLPPTTVPIPVFSSTGDLLPENAHPMKKPPLASSVQVSVQDENRVQASRLVVSARTPASSLPVQGQSLTTFYSWLRPRLGGIAGVLYAIIAITLLTRFALGVLLSRRLVHASTEVFDGRLRTCLALVNTGQRKFPRVFESESVSVPVTIGVLRPSILLPATWRSWDDAMLNSVIAHESSHIARYDALMQHISLLHSALFWFSPLAWWLERHLAALAEEASDEAALVLGVDRNRYARTLLGFLETLQNSQRRIWWQGVSMANGGCAERRLERILAWKGSMMNLNKSVVVAIVGVAVPLVCLVASARPARQSERAPLAQPAPPSSNRVLPSPAAPSVVPAISTAPIAGVVAPAIAPAPPSLWSQQSSGTSEGNFSYGYGFDDDERFVIASGKSDSFTMSGTTQDARHVERLKKQIPGDFIWFQRDEKSYIIRDQAIVDRARSFWAPQEELGKKQEELGRQQEALGKQQEELGSKMEQVRVKVPDITATLDALKAKLQKLGPTATMEQIGDLQSEIGELQSKIGEIQSQAGEQQGKLGEEQGKLGEQQGKLGEQQGKLGEQQAKLAREATQKMKGLLDECIKNGKAQPETDNSSTGASL